MIQENQLALVVAALGRRAARSPPSRCSRSARAWSATASPAPPSASTAGAPDERRRRRPSRSRACASSCATPRSTSSTRSRSRSRPGEVLGLVGESGSGKTTVGLALLGHTRRGAEIAGGSIRVGDVDILALSSAGRRSVRGRLVSLRAAGSRQPPSTRRCASARSCARRSRCTTSARAPRSAPRASRRSCARSRCPTTPAYLRRYPHELSGGQQQRIGLAMAFACRPSLIVLDEPTTGLDVTTQAHVLGTVRELAAAHRVAALYVSHDLAVVGTLAERVAVMYAGRIVELGADATSCSRRPRTRTRAGSLQAIPHLSGARELIGIPGPRALARRTAAGLRVRPALHLRAGRLPRGAAAAARARARALACAACAPRRCARASCPARAVLEEHVQQARADEPVLSLEQRLRGLRRRHGRARRQPRARAATSASRWSASPVRARPRWRARSAVCTVTAPA